MTAVLQVTCPGCRTPLGVPPEAAHHPLRCPRCALVLRLKPASTPAPAPRSAPAPRTPSGTPARPVMKKKSPPARKAPPPLPAKQAAPRPAAPRRGSLWKGLLVAFAVLVLAGTATAASWNRLRPLLLNRPSPAAEAGGAETSALAAPPPHEATDKVLPAPPVVQEEPEKAPAGPPTYARDVAPLVQKYCVRCHSGSKPRGGLALDRDRDDQAAVKNKPTWEKVAESLRNGEMPPPNAKRPSASESDLINTWLDAVVLKVDCSSTQDPGRVTIRRLNRAEYANTVRDLLGVNFQAARDFPADDVGYGFDNIGDVLSIPPMLLEKYLAAAEQVVEQAFKDPDLRKRILTKNPRDRGSAFVILQEFATRAYRRPATSEEVKRLMRFVQEARNSGDDAETGIKVACQAVLCSPHFLFRVELDDRDRGSEKGGAALNDWEVASRLSYFLWSSMPDEELFKLAREGKLSDPDVLAVQVKRMLRDHKSQALADNFASQWLQVRTLESFNPDPKKFPSWSPALRRDLLKETELFFLHVAREDRPILEFLDSDYTFANERLAKLYGLKDVKGEEFRKVSLAGTPRGGVLTQGSVLAVTSNPTRTSPVKRGKFILESFLGSPPPPPPEVEELPDDKGGELKGTLRQRLEQHRANPSCASCHQRMDPLGFGFENFDPIGSWRTHEGKHPIDASGELPGGYKFSGPGELRKVLLERKDQFAKCVTEKMLTYAIGRGVERADRCFVERITAELTKDDYKFSTLVIEIVKSDPFLRKRARGGK